MHNKNSNSPYYPSHPDLKHSLPSYDPSTLDNPALLPDKAPPFKSSRHKPTFLQTSISNPPEGRYQNVNYSDHFKTQAIRIDSASYDDTTAENRRLSKWPRNQKDLKRGPSANNDGRSPAQARDKIPSKTLPTSSGSLGDIDKSKSHSRIRSSLYGSKESDSNGTKDYVSPRFRKAKATGATKKSKTGRRRHEMGQTSSHTQQETESSVEEQGSGGRLCLTEKLNPKKLLSPNYDEKRSGRGQTTKRRQEKERTKSKKSETSRYKGASHKVTAFDDKMSKSQENREYGEIVRNSRRYDTRSHREVPEEDLYDEEYKEWDDNMGYTDHFGSRDYRDWYMKSQEQSKVIELEEEIRDKDYKLEYMNRCQNDLYQDLVAVKGELEKTRDENQAFVSDIKYYVSQCEILKRKLSMQEHQTMLLADENQRLIGDQIQRSELINAMEAHVTKLKTEVSSLTKKCSDQAESYNTKIVRIEREKQGLLHDKGKLEKKLEDYEKRYEIRSQEDKSLVKTLDEKNHQIWELKQRNEKLVEEVERLRIQKEELLKRPHINETEAGATKYGPELYEPKRLLEQTLTQGKYENSPEMFFDMRRSRAETEKMRADTDHSKFNELARSTMKKFEDFDMSVEKLGESVNKDKGKKIQKSLDFGELSRIIKEIIQEIGVEDIYDAVKKIREIQENNRTEKKFVSAILDLVYRCSPKGNFESKPTTRQAWKWLQKLMEEYMMIKKNKNTGGPDSAIDKEIIKNLTEFLSTPEKREIVEKVKNMASENVQMKGVIDKLKAAGVEHSFGIGEVDKLIDRHHTSYSSHNHSYNTAKFEDSHKPQRGLKEISFGRTAGPKLRKMLDKESFEIAEVMVKKESD